MKLLSSFFELQVLFLLRESDSCRFLPQMKGGGEDEPRAGSCSVLLGSSLQTARVGMLPVFLNTQMSWHFFTQPTMKFEF